MALAAICLAAVGIVLQFSGDRPTHRQVQPSGDASDGRSLATEQSYRETAEPGKAVKAEVLQNVAGKIAKNQFGTTGRWVEGLSVPELISKLRDESVPRGARHQVALQLAKLGGDEALTALKDAAANGTAPLKALVAEALGQSHQPESEAILLSMLMEDDEVVRRGVIRGLAAIGDANAMSLLSSMLAEAAYPPGIRAAAAAGLGEINHPEVYSILKTAFYRTTDQRIKEEVLAGLGKQPFETTQGFFQVCLDSPDLSRSLRVTAIEALENTEGNVTPFLLKYAQDKDPEVRAASAWALAIQDSTGGIGDQLVSLLAREQDAEVRMRLYQALVRQPTFDLSKVVPLVANEQNEQTRLAGLTAWAAYCKSSDQNDAVQQFDRQAVPELQQAALSTGDLGARLGSVIALRRAGTSGAYDALHTIAAQNTDPRIVQAAQAALGQINGRTPNVHTAINQ